MIEALEKDFMSAVSDAFDEEYGFIKEKEAAGYRHEFSEKFSSGIRDLMLMSEKRYVRFGKRMIRRSLAVVLAAVLVVGACGIVYAMSNAIINWTAIKSEEGKDNLSVWFEAENVDDTVFEKVLYKPKAQDGMTEIYEKYNPEALIYEVEYSTTDDKTITYIELMGVTDEGKYFGVKIEGELVEEVMVGEHSGTRYYDEATNEIILLWTDGSTLFELSGDLDFESLLRMAENLGVVKTLD